MMSLNMVVYYVLGLFISEVKKRKKGGEETRREDTYVLTFSFL
jgi:hypothetical protein